MKRKQAGQYITFGMVDRSSGDPYAGGILPQVYISRNGGDLQTPLYQVEEMGNGQYRVLLTEFETDTDELSFVATAMQAVSTEKTIYTK